MQRHLRPEILTESAVINLLEGSFHVVNGKTFKVDALLDATKRQLSNQEAWINEGFQCEMLIPGGLWRKGRIRLQMEFCPDPEEVEEM